MKSTKEDSMPLTAHRNIHAPEVIEVVNEHGPLNAGVVYRFNEKHHVGTRTNGHAGERPTMKQIRAAIAELA